jgi:hypothetical protein
VAATELTATELTVTAAMVTAATAIGEINAVADTYNAIGFNRWRFC